MMRPDTKSDRCADADGKNSGEPDQPEILDPNDTNLVRDRIKGQTDEHASRPGSKTKDNPAGRLEVSPRQAALADLPPDLDRSDPMALLPERAPGQVPALQSVYFCER